MSLAKPQLDRFHRAGYIDGLIVIYEGEIELMRQMTALQEDLENSRRETAPSNASANSSYPFHLLVSVMPVLSHAVHINSNSL